MAENVGVKYVSVHLPEFSRDFKSLILNRCIILNAFPLQIVDICKDKLSQNEAYKRVHNYLRFIVSSKKEREPLCITIMFYEYNLILNPLR